MLTLRRIAAVVGLLLLCSCGEPDADKARRFLENGKKLAAAKDWRRAILLFKLSARHAPRQAEPLYQLGMAQLAARDATAAFATFYKAARMQPPHAGASLKLAEMMIASGDREMIADSHRHINAVLAAEPANREALQCRAAALFSEGDLAGSEAAARQVLALEPGSAAARLSIALVRIAQKDYPAAELSLRESLERNPNSAAAAVTLGRFYLLTGRRQEAEAQFQRAVTIDDGNAPALVELAALKMAAGQPQHAGDIYKRLSALPYREYHVLHAVFLSRTGDKAGAVRELEALWKQDSEDREVRTSLVRAYADAGRHSDAERILSGSLAKNGKDIDALLQMAELFPHLRGPAQRESDLRTVLRYRPRSAEAHFMLAQAYKSRGATRSQMQHLQEALNCDASLLIARLALSELLLASGDAEGSLRLLDAAPPAHREMLPAAVQRNWALLQLGRNREAEQALAQTPAAALIPELILQRAILAVNRKDMRAAAADLEEVLRQRPEDVRALQLLADIHLGEGRHKQAVDRVRAQAEAHPANASLWECLGRILLASGDTAGAARSFDTALRHDPGRWRLQLELVRLDINSGRFDSARQRLAGLKPAVKEHPATLVLQGVVEEQSGNLTAAIACYRKVLQMEPRNEIALNNLAWRLAEQDSTLDEGLHLAQRAREVSGAPAVDHTFGWICYRKGLYRTAIDHLSAAAAKQPTARRKYDLACAYLKAGKTGLASQTYAAARAMDQRLPELPRSVPLQHAPLPPP